MAKYLNPKADLTFKKIFGEHPKLVISLLNALLPLNEDERVESIEYWPAEKIPRRTQSEKDSIVDVCCHDNKNREFIVEMQMTWTNAFKKRVLLNASKAYVAQSEVGEAFQLLQPVYALNFVNALMNIGTDGYYHHYQLVHQEKSDEVIDGLQLVFIELPKFKPSTFSEKKMQVLWLRFLTEINEKTLNAPEELLNNPEVNEALKIVEVAAYTPEEMRAYDKFWDNVSTQKTLELARQQEMEEAMAIKKQAEAELQKAKAESEKAKAESEKAKAESEKAKAESEKAKAESEKAKAESEKAKAESEKAKAESEKAKAESEKAKAESEKAKAESKKAKAESEKAKTRLSETALKMKTDGLPIDIIAKYTGLTVNEIEEL